MKGVIFGLALMAAGAAAAQDTNPSETIQGNGKLVTRDVSVMPFDALKASGVYELQLLQGDKESVRIEADENLQDYFAVRNEGTELVVDMKKTGHKNVRSSNKMRVYITFKKLKAMDLSTVGNVAAEAPLSFDHLNISNKSVGNIDLKMTVNLLDLKNSSVGNVKLSGTAEQAVVKNNGVGALQAGGFVVQTMNIENTGVGNAEVNAEKDLKVKDSFLGRVRNKGGAVVRKMKRVRV